MTRKEEIRDKSDELGQRYFPDAKNVWGRANIEAQCVSSACMEIAQWADKTIIDKACEWWSEWFDTHNPYNMGNCIDDFRKAMEEKL